MDGRTKDASAKVPYAAECHVERFASARFNIEESLKLSTTLAATCTFIGATLSYAVAQTPEPTLSPAPAPSLLEMVATDPAQPIRARVGQTFALALRSHRSTGFSWQLSDPPGAAVQAVGSAYEERSSPIGGGSQEIWLFKAVAAGTAIVTLRYVRPFEKGSALMERAATFRIDVVP